MKRIAAFLLIICMSVLIFAIPTSAEGEVFVAAGNTVLPLTDAMPIRSNGAWYIDYQCFTKGGLKVSASYNATEGKLVLYTWDITLIFDLNTATAYTVHDEVQYKALAVAAAGTVYIPAQFTAQLLGLEYVYYSDLPLIRIKRPTDIQNNMFLFIAEKEIQPLLEKYRAEKAKQNAAKPPSPQTSTTPAPEKVQNLRLTFNVTSGENLSQIISNLAKYGYRATFFVKSDMIADSGNELRRAVTSGHALGIYADSPDDLSIANKKLFDVTKTKSRLVRFSSGSSKLSKEDIEKAISSGFRIWDYNIMPTGDSSSKIYSQSVSKLVSNTRAQVLALPDSPSALSALPRILSYLNQNKFGSYTINLLDTPVNQISERR